MTSAFMASPSRRRILGDDLAAPFDEPQRLVVLALSDIAPEDQAGRSGRHRARAPSAVGRRQPCGHGRLLPCPPRSSRGAGLAQSTKARMVGEDARTAPAGP